LLIRRRRGLLERLSFRSGRQLSLLDFCALRNKTRFTPRSGLLQQLVSDEANS
jgi:hypothetical protein